MTSAPAARDLPYDVTMRLVRVEDAGSFADTYLRNRAHLAPWEPTREDAFYTEDAQRTRIEATLEVHAGGERLPLVLVRDGEVVGGVNLNDIVRGAFQNAHLGYWVDEAIQGHGVMTAAVREVVDIARDDLGLHRLQAGTLPENTRSQAVLAANGFARFGVAPEYLEIAGRWQDHVLFQRILF